MAIVNKLDRSDLEHASNHTNVKGTYSIVIDQAGHKFLQIDTYGSSSRKILDEKSQSMRFSTEAIEQLKKIIKDEF